MKVTFEASAIQEDESPSDNVLLNSNIIGTVSWKEKHHQFLAQIKAETGCIVGYHSFAFADTREAAVTQAVENGIAEGKKIVESMEKLKAELEGN